MRRAICRAISVSFILSCVVHSAVRPGIAVVTAEGELYMNGAKTSGNATVFEGATIENGTTDSRVHFDSGAQLRLSSGSQSEIFSGHVDVRRGTVRIEDYAAYAGDLVVHAPRGSVALVVLNDERAVQVSSLNGDVRVSNRAGNDIASIPAGRALEFRRQREDAAGSYSLAGCAFRMHNDIFLTDETSNLTVQLRGDAIAIGKRLEIQGAAIPGAVAYDPATQVIRVNTAKRSGDGCGADASKQKQGLAATAATAAVVAGVAAAVIMMPGSSLASALPASTTGGGSFHPLATGSGPGKKPVSSGRLGAFN